MGFLKVILSVALLCQAASAARRCCGFLGCFQDKSPFSHLPLPDCPEELEFKMKLFTRQNRYDGKSIGVRLPNFEMPDEFSKYRKTVFLIHGWLGDESTSWYDSTGHALLDKADLNLVRVSWAGGAQDIWYPSAASSTRVTGAMAGELARYLVENMGQSHSDIWCIGHSLGAHSCGHMGHRYHIGRITGFDPAGPLFKNYPRGARLNMDAADFVDVIHTNGQPSILIATGIWIAIGHVDIYPNGGKEQPGCLLDPMDAGQQGDLSIACSHHRAIWYFEEALNNPDCQKTVMQKCRDIDNMPGSCEPCEGSDCTVLGLEAEQQPGRGVFYMTTRSSEPWCRG